MTVETEQAIEKIARRMCKEAGQSSGLWELFLNDAYREYFQMDSQTPGQVKLDGKAKTI